MDDDFVDPPRRYICLITNSVSEWNYGESSVSRSRIGVWLQRDGETCDAFKQRMAEKRDALEKEEGSFGRRRYFGVECEFMSIDDDDEEEG